MGDRKGLVSAEALAARLEGAGPPPVVVDMREHPRDGLGAIPGSPWVDLHDGFAQRRPGRNLSYDLPLPEEVAGTLSRLGVTPDSEVVFADDMLNRWATRAYWVLKYYGHRGPVRVLDGGLPAWRRSGLPVVPGFAAPSPAGYPVPVVADPSILATAAEVLAGVTDGSVLPCDVRRPEEYSGEEVWARRGGHVPGAVHVPFERCLDGEGRFLVDDALEQVLQPFLATGRAPVTYCQGGIRASLTWFCLHELLGRPARLYAASWEEWGQMEDLPVASM